MPPPPHPNKKLATPVARHKRKSRVPRPRCNRNNVANGRKKIPRTRGTAFDGTTDFVRDSALIAADAGTFTVRVMLVVCPEPAATDAGLNVMLDPVGSPLAANEIAAGVEVPPVNEAAKLKVAEAPAEIVAVVGEPLGAATVKSSMVSVRTELVTDMKVVSPEYAAVIE